MILLVLGFMFSTGMMQELFAGPKTPLPRVNLGLGFGTDLKDILEKFPGCEDRSFNNDPLFRIITLKGRQDLPEGASESELIFFEGKLYFVSAKWEDGEAVKIPVESWARQFRRWNRRFPAPSASLQGDANDTLLKEWYFDDGNTELILRNLEFKKQVNRWKDLRDTSNANAQNAFAKYRFDLQ
jgi:hypothetical protein